MWTDDISPQKIFPRDPMIPYGPPAPDSSMIDDAHVERTHPSFPVEDDVKRFEESLE